MLKMFFRHIIFTAGLILSAAYLHAQCLTYPVSFSSRTVAASVIVEGKVLSQNSFWNSSHDFIYTASEIQVYKIFKGTVAAGNIFVITEGGTVGSDMVVVEPSLTFSVDDRGIIFLQSTSIINPQVSYPAGSVFEAYALRQGFVKYD